MKIAFLMLCLVVFIGSQSVEYRIDKVRQYIYNNSTFSADINERYAAVIYQYSGDYGLEPMRIAKQVWTESRFKWYAYNSAGAYGPMQIRPKFWSHILYRVDDGKLAKMLLNSDKPEYKKYFMRIGYGVEAGCIIMAYLKKRNDYDYRMALVEYWAGSSSEEYSKAKSSERYLTSLKYIQDIVE